MKLLGWESPNLLQDVIIPSIRFRQQQYQMLQYHLQMHTLAPAMQKGKFKEVSFGVTHAHTPGN